MFRYFVIIVLSGLFVQSVSAQTLKGVVYEDKTHIALAGVNVQNTNTKQMTTTDNNGKFSIAVKQGDLVTFRIFSYRPDTLLVADMRDHEVYLTPQINMLSDVKVTSTATRNESPSIYRDQYYRGQTVVNSVDKDGNPTGGATMRLSYFKKDENKAKKLAQEEKDDKVREEIAKVFSEDNIGKYIPLKGDELKAFVIRYTPDVATYTSPGFNLTSYLSASYREFGRLSPEERKPQKLQ